MSSEPSFTGDSQEKNKELTFESKKNSLTIAQKAQIETNRQKALLIRQEKLNKRKLHQIFEQPQKPKVIRVNNTKLVDTEAGFYIEEKPNELTRDDIEAAMHLVTEPAPLVQDQLPFCEECSQPFDKSYLMHNFDQSVCNNCRDKVDKHGLITKTDAKNDYLLKDCDFESRKPILKYILKKNPHNSQWGDMKLYLKCQVEKRALEVWGTEEAIEEELLKKDDKRKEMQKKKFMKKMKELRMNARSSLYTRATKTHKHDYDPEVYLEEEDEYSRTCASCGHSYTYDKM